MSIDLLAVLLVCVSMYIATLAACRTELQSMTETRTCCRRQVIKPKRKLVMILTAANDFFSDALYVSTAKFVSPGLQGAAILFFVLPTVMFCVVGRDFMQHLDVCAGAWNRRNAIQLVRIAGRCLERERERCTVADIVVEVDALAARSASSAGGGRWRSRMRAFLH